MRLVYVRSSGAAQCPDEPALRAAVAVRIGNDPFRDDAPSAVSAAIDADAGGLHARVERWGPDGRVTGARDLHSSGSSCEELASSVALAISIAIDPLAFKRVAPSPPPQAPAPPALPSAPVPPAPALPQPLSSRAALAPPASSTPPTPPPREPIIVGAAIGVLGVVGQAPAPALGLRAEFDLRSGPFAFAAGGRVDLSSGHDRDAGGHVSSSLAVGELAPCWYRASLLGCAVVEVGALQGFADGLRDTHQRSSLYAAAGVRVGVDLPVGGGLFLRPTLEALATLTRTTLVVEATNAWVSPPIALNAGLSAAVTF